MLVRRHTRAVLLGLRRLFCLSVLLLLSSSPTISQAQITLDGSLGPRGALRGPNYTISDSVGQIRGSNLFHSFGQFNLSKGESATFTGPNTIANILSRVTGGSPSSIDGTIRSQIPRANLYVLNPSGVMFGPNASLDVSGSFHVSTADYLRLADGATFSANSAVPTVLSVAPPAAFGFLGPTPAPLSIQGSALQVPAGQTVSVIGGDIAIVSGVLVASGGRLNLASAATAGEVGMNPADPTAPLQVGSVATLGQMHLVDARLDASGIRGGTVVLRGGRLMLENTSIAADTQGDVHGAGVGIDIGVIADAVVTNGSLLSADVGGAGNAGSIRIVADSLEVSQASLIRSQSAAGTTGDVGDIDITARLMQVTDGSQVSGVTRGAGRGGDVTVRASEALTITGQDADGNVSAVLGDTFGSGAAGRVTVSAPRLVLDGPVLISSASLEGSTGNAGTVVVDGGTITLSGGASITTSTFGSGRGGDVTVRASEALTITGQDADGKPSGVLSSTSGSGAAGRVTVAAPTLRMDDGVIQAHTASGSSGDAGSILITAGSMTLTGGAQIDSSSAGSGSGGQVIVTATDPVLLTGQGTGLFTRAAGSGRGGDITVQAPRVTLLDDAIISAESTGLGHAGNITLTLGDSFMSTHGSIITRATLADGGNIQITAPNFLRLRDSAITAEVGGGAATVGGNISIDPQFVLLQNSQIVANAFAGQGGNIRIQAQQVFLADPTSQVSASSALGINGQVAIQAPIANVSGTVASLPQVFARAGELLRDRCVERVRGGIMSRFVLGGRDGVPLEPGSLLLSPPVRAEQPAVARMTESVAGQREVSFGPVGGLESDNTSYLSLRGAHVQAQWLEALDVECARWRWMQGTDVKTVP